MLSDRESELLNELTAICQANSLDIHINELPDRALAGKPCSLDVEHDEAGNFVCCGLYFGDGGPVYSIFDIQLLRNCNLHTLAIIAHNGVGDLECLRHWNIQVTSDQLYWDTFLIGHIIDSSQKGYGLKDMAKRELGISYPDYDTIVGKHKGKTKKNPKCPQIAHDCCGRITLDKQPVALVSAYNSLDVYTTYKLYDLQKKRAIS